LPVFSKKNNNNKTNKRAEEQQSQHKRWFYLTNLMQRYDMLKRLGDGSYGFVTMARNRDSCDFVSFRRAVDLLID